MRVKLERLVWGIDGDGDGSNGGHSLLQLRLVTFGQIDEPHVGRPDVGPAEPEVPKLSLNKHLLGRVQYSGVVFSILRNLRIFPVSYNACSSLSTFVLLGSDCIVVYWIRPKAPNLSMIKNYKRTIGRLKLWFSLVYFLRKIPIQHPYYDFLGKLDH